MLLCIRRPVCQTGTSVLAGHVFWMASSPVVAFVFFFPVGLGPVSQRGCA